MARRALLALLQLLCLRGGGGVAGLGFDMDGFDSRANVLQGRQVPVAHRPASGRGSSPWSAARYSSPVHRPRRRRPLRRRCFPRRSRESRRIQRRREIMEERRFRPPLPSFQTSLREFLKMLQWLSSPLFPFVGGVPLTAGESLTTDKQVMTNYQHSKYSFILLPQFIHGHWSTVFNLI
jgi:hypothetical protein